MKTATTRQVTAERLGSDVLHIEADDCDDDQIWVMACGVTAIMLDSEPFLSPPIDFYHRKSWRKATCPECRAYYETCCDG